MFHILGYFVSAGVNDANVALAAVTDGEFSARNSNFIFSEQYDLIGAAHLAASALRARFNVPALNAFARYQIWPVNRSATPPSNPRIMDLRDMPLQLPMNEEIAIEESNNLGAATEDTTTFLWVTPRGLFNRNKPRGQAQLMVRATGALARVGDTWATGGTITFTETLRGGWYAVTGAWCQSANLRAFRLNFVRGNVVNGRRLKPGHLVSNAVGDIEPNDFRKDDLGVWGYFHSFEPPTLEVYGDATGADTQELRFELQYLGEGAPVRA